MSYESVWLGLKVNFPFLSYLSVHKNNIQLYDQKKFVHIVEERKESFQRASQPLWWLRSDSCPVMQSPKERLKASSNTHIHNPDRPEPDVFIYASSYTLTHFFVYYSICTNIHAEFSKDTARHKLEKYSWVKAKLKYVHKHVCACPAANTHTHINLWELAAAL